MKRQIICVLLAIALLAGCTNIQRGTLVGALIGGGIGAGIGAAGGGVGVAIGAGVGAGTGAVLGMVAGEVYEVHKARMKEEYADYNPETGAAVVTTKTLAEYEKRLAAMEAKNRYLLAQNEKLIAASYTIADAINADGRYVRVDTTPEGVLQVTLVSEVLFEPGSAKLKEAIYPVLDEIGRSVTKDYPDYYIAIEGHTDPSEVSSTGYRSNWELSSARALSVLHYFSDRGLIDEQHLAVAGYGSERPVADPSTPDGQRMNRRVVITLMPNKPAAVPHNFK
ncbi:MAG: hypothetical protein DRI44_08670 [Chlamydiae bacterium]|nr:MAG: hypothetical protein DRI44_08670 [Chlamydiota bacterium]